MEKVMYTARAVSTGGRSGHVRSENGELDVDVRPPGTSGNYLNPEILFAGGYAACFDSAIAGVLKLKKLQDVTHQTTLQVTLGEIEKHRYGFEIVIEVGYAGMDAGTADEVVKQAHQMCPYSNAISGNVKVEVVVKALATA
jgi:lipoyl-dependent peroxiredoxin